MSKEKKLSIGGQALIEGVMMRGPKETAMAVRLQNGDIIIEKWDNKESKLPKICKLPFIRGIFNFVDSMVVGYKTLMRSAELSEFEGEEEVKADTDVDVDAEDNEKPATKEEKAEVLGTAAMGVITVIASILSMVLAIGLFVYLPTAIFNWLKGHFEVLDSRTIQSVCEGILKLIIFITYMALISLMNDIKRVFMYHGAEHKTIFCYEKGLELTVENVRKQSRFHPRCGTSFIMLSVIISIGVAMCIPHTIPTVARSAIKILLLPVTMGIGYEAIKLAGRKDNTFTKIISAPGLWVQRISTKEPDEDYMIECAIKAFKEVLPKDN